jgi:nucleoid DNA-binding protein
MEITRKKRAEGEHTENYLRILERRKREAGYKLYKKTEIVELLAGVCDLPKQKIGNVFDAFCDLLVEISHTESIVQFPKFGRIIFEPKSKRRIWNPKEGRVLLYQNPRITLRLANRLRIMLRRQFRRNCYQLYELNGLTPTEYKARDKKEGRE